MLGTPAWPDITPTSCGIQDAAARQLSAVSDPATAPPSRGYAVHSLGFDDACFSLLCPGSTHGLGLRASVCHIVTGGYDCELRWMTHALGVRRPIVKWSLERGCLPSLNPPLDLVVATLSC
jgi:hypothetical protein